MSDKIGPENRIHAKEKYGDESVYLRADSESESPVPYIANNHVMSTEKSGWKEAAQP